VKPVGTKRHFQIGERMKRTLMLLFREGRFEHEVRDMFSILEVSPSNGYERAYVFVAALDAAKTDSVVARLNELSGAIRRELAAEANLRTTPALVFKADRTLEVAGRLDALLGSDGVRKDLASK
jgi:ribosome-binding factor A